ncbi:ABC transporter ATP-binding protein [Campylobacter canadensis]|uniref:ABC transporter ATP-binding protein n=1 Tax=Campylobacter canadensis TaxID=449520 RepID=UPI001557F28F|nr:ABC transporter ATP-binding protein [Campylobacter canadensis]MBZ7994778.1 ABC transporter ATP-binding protein [Campylobacter canadensis]MBZ7996514.1 ABC transporter ATP-binding protein [Campylobacter canadensis]MBZ8000204.1 ABC transporter ATP-binding protein [Campylobacter canadensis]MBZ8001839.1 ABC transporter ATP-binding protein [Campylobacter canadensis]MBZ8004129.1 ABC transporter ATP-binding protein [Campylobacter canadensis]
MDEIIVKDLNVNYGDIKLLDEINIKVSSGKIIALLGSSGSGKSLLATTIMGYLANNLKLSGNISLKSGEALKNKLAFIMQNPRTAFNPLFSIRNCVYESLQAWGLKKDIERIKNVFNSVGLEENILSLYPHECSGGMLQRVMIAIALLSNASFIIADEPTSDLDLLSQAAVLDILEKLKQEKNMGILLITHDFGVVARLADYVYIIEEGKIIEQNDCLKLFLNPKTSLSSNLIKAHLALYGEFNA